MIEKATKVNRDGWGMTVADRGKLTTVRGLKMVDALPAIRAAERETALIHFRIATAGSICEENCQPLVVGKDLVLAHNGTIIGLAEPPKSDTRILSERLSAIEALHPGIILTPDFAPFLIAMISHGWSKLAFLTADGVFFFLKKSEFTERGGLFLSNLTWEQSGEWTGVHGYTYTPTPDPTDPRGIFTFQYKSYTHKRADRYYWKCTGCKGLCYMENSMTPGWCPSEDCVNNEAAMKMAVTMQLELD